MKEALHIKYRWDLISRTHRLPKKNKIAVILVDTFPYLYVSPVKIIGSEPAENRLG